MHHATVLIVPGLRGHVPGHWQTLLAERLPRVCCVPPTGREHLDCRARLAAVEEAACAVDGPLLVVAHSAGCLTVAHWALRTGREVLGALLAAPPDFEQPLPTGYPTLSALHRHGWLPVPHRRLPFPSLVAASRNDPLAAFERVAGLAADWGSRVVDLGEVGHLNPDAGFGEWPRALELVAQLAEPAGITCA